MITLFTEYFELNLSSLGVKFSEENSFFQKDLIKQYSFPFTIPKTRSNIPFFEFMASHHGTQGNELIPAVLFKVDQYYDAEFMVVTISGRTEMVIYYEFDQLTILDSKLKSLPWPTIDLGDDIFDFAEQTVLKDYPATKVNFPQIYAPELYKDYNFGSYLGYINYNKDQKFSEISATAPHYIPQYLLYQMNEMRPFIYLMEIMTNIFDQLGYTMVGDVVTNGSIQKCLMYSQNSIFYTNKDYKVVVDIRLFFIENFYNRWICW